MKGIVRFMISFSIIFMLFSSVVPASASENEEPATAYTPESDGQEEVYSYTIEGVEYISIVPLTDGHLDELTKMNLEQEEKVKKEKKVKETPLDDLFTPYVVVTDGGGAAITYGPYYKTHSNMEFRYFAGAVVTYATRRIPYSRVAYERMASLLGFNLGFAASEFITPTHTGSWQYKVYESGRYRIYNTLVHYKYGNFTSPYKVYTYPVGWE